MTAVGCRDEGTNGGKGSVDEIDRKEIDTGETVFTRICQIDGNVSDESSTSDEENDNTDVERRDDGNQEVRRSGSDQAERVDSDDSTNEDDDDDEREECETIVIMNDKGLFTILNTRTLLTVSCSHRAILRRNGNE